jgi:hypothetical protein
MLHLGVDTIGPFVGDKEGHKHILVIQCSFSRFAELTPLKTLDAATAAKEVFKHFCRYGAPMTLRSDNGTQFCNEIIKELLRMTGTEHIRTVAYSHEENGMVERCNKEVNRHLRALVHEIKRKDKWAELVPLVQRIYNTSDCASIGVSPARLIFGNNIQSETRLDQEPCEITAGDKVAGRWLDYIFAEQERLINKARAIQLETSRKKKQFIKDNETVIEPNSYVLLRPPEKQAEKIDTPLSGPWRCVEILGDSVVIMNLIYNNIKTVHRSRIVPFRYNKERTDPRQVAMKDNQEFEVEKIIKIRGLDGNRRSGIEALVRWTGYDEDEDSWVPWSEIHNNEKFHEYLRSKKELHKFLPAQRKKA